MRITCNSTSGSTITKNIPPYALALCRAEQKTIEGWVAVADPDPGVRADEAHVGSLVADRHPDRLKPPGDEARERRGEGDLPEDLEPDRRADQREMLAGVKRGDRVVIGGGIIGLVTKVIGENELQVELAEGVRVRIIKQTITDIVTRGESVRGGKESEEDEKPMLPAAPAAPERKSLLGSLFGGGKKQG